MSSAIEGACRKLIPPWKLAAWLRVNVSNWCSLSGLEGGMPTYYFNLKGIQERYLDPYGTELADDAQAREHARQVALELMQGREGKTRSWRLEICDVTRSPIFELLFAKVDPTLTELPPNFRTTVEQACARTGALVDAIGEIRNTFQELRATLSKSDGKPFLAASDGVALKL